MTNLTDEQRRNWYAIGAVLCFVAPPIGCFIVAYLFTDELSED